MSRLQEIENALISINDAVFQELCDSFLKIRNPQYATFVRTGSQKGKQKTKKGTPDSFFHLHNGNFIYVESTTDVTNKNKLADDINACFNVKKTKIPIKKIETIILCFNFNIDPSDVVNLNNLAKSYKKNIQITLWPLDSLSLELCWNHPNLVHEYLGLHLDTGQIVSLDKFISEYNQASNSIATPLDNKFVHRESEKEEIKNALITNDIIILTGSPGVGKTKLAIETISDFIAESDNYIAYCISYKSHYLLDDLILYIDNNNNYILFVDDANRIDHFNQIIGFFKSVTNNNLKIIITVRDYALNQINLLCQEYDPHVISVNKLSDDQVIDIISAKDFEILNRDYQREIVRIADGNPRIAIMASLLAKEKQNLYALSDVSQLFEKYYATFIKDQSEFENKLNIKVLGLIAFFNTLPFKDKNLISNILEDFDIDYNDFIEVIDNLDQLELLEIQFDNVKITEQNLSTYFFYKAFVKDNLLSFQILLNKHFDNNSDRFRDCVIPAHNTFGRTIVMETLKPYLKDYLTSINENVEKSYKFLETFWYYLIDETLEFLYSQISLLPEIDTDHYEVHYEQNAFSYKQDRTIELLGNLFRIHSNLRDIIEIAFDYTRKLPEHLPELIYKIRDVLTFDINDEKIGYKRQNILFDYLISGLNKGDELLTEAFYALSQTFLGFEYEHIRGGRNMSVEMYFYPLQNNLEIREFRTRIWKEIDQSFDQNIRNSIDLLNSYPKYDRSINTEIIENEIPFILELFDKHLSNDTFQSCKCVNDFIIRCRNHGINDKRFDFYMSKFTNKTYEMYTDFNWNMFYDRQNFKFGKYKDYYEFKETSLRSKYIFKNLDQVSTFYNDFVFLQSEIKNEWHRNKTLDIIINENCTQSFEIGFELLKLIVEHDNKIKYYPMDVFRNLLNKNEQVEKIWDLIHSRKFPYKIILELSFYDYLDEILVNNDHPKRIVSSIKEADESVRIHFGNLTKYLTIDEKLFHKILIEIHKHNEEEKIKVLISDSLIEENFVYLGDDLQLIKQVYLQQIKLQDHFDFDGKALLRLLMEDASILEDFVLYCYNEKERRFNYDHRDLSVIWEISNIEEYLTDVLKFVYGKDPSLGIVESFCNSFFKNVNIKYSDRVDNFLLSCVNNNFDNTDIVNTVVDIVRNSRNHLFEDILLLYVSLNQDPNDFSKIWWRGNGGFIQGDQILGDIETADWYRISKIIEKSDIGIKLSPIKKYINQEIENSKRHGDWERHRKFTGDYL